tara:strand:- start:7 stop:216 length:210 start_codon:yes stop_codon:yes gene_type:complete
MSNIKRFIMDVEEKVFGLDLEAIVTESDTVQEATNKVVSVFKKEFTTFEMDIAKDVVTRSWNEYWADYV